MEIKIYEPNYKEWKENKPYMVFIYEEPFFTIEAFVKELVERQEDFDNVVEGLEKISFEEATELKSKYIDNLSKK